MMLNVLIVEDAESDTHLIVHLLQKAGYDVNHIQVQAADEMRNALQAQAWDIVISDFNLPQFDGFTALMLCHALAPNIPFIILSGAVSEGNAAEMLRLGASDFIPKSKFPRLVQVVERELVQAKIRQAQIDEHQALLKERLRLKAILDGAVDAVILLDTHGTVLSFNPAAAKIFAYRESDMLGQSVSKLMPESDAKHHATYLQRYLETGEAHLLGKSRELVGQRSNGEQFPMDLSISTWYDGEQHNFTWVARDITERKMIQSQLAQSQKMESLMQLSGGLAHDFNNLLGIIIGNLDFLEARLSGDEKSKTYLDSALRAALRGADITRRMLNLSRMQHTTGCSLQTHNINRLIEEIVAILHRTLGPTYAISTALLPDLPLTQLDPAEFENAILNLALNARDAMPDGGQLVIVTRMVTRDEVRVLAVLDHSAANTYVLVEISDTGQGMPSEVLAHAMDPFFSTKNGVGTGLGLAMVYGFVQSLKGAINIYSEAGHGTAIHLYLPATEQSRSSAQINVPAMHDLARGSETILVVDDESDLLVLTIDHLSSLGYKTIAAGNGADAMALLERTPEIDLLLTDVVMPGGMLGTELAVLAQQLRPILPVILCSGFPKKIQDNALHAKYAQDILHKPFRKFELAQAIRRKLDASDLNAMPNKAVG